jgi:hypothetical protein
MFAKLVELFGCWHSRFSFPVTIRRNQPKPAAAFLTGTYVACLNCGQEFPYDWREMKVITLSGGAPRICCRAGPQASRLNGLSV